MRALLEAWWCRTIGPMIFKPAARYPADPRVIFILALSAFGGIGALAIDQGPGTLEALLPRWGVLLWGVFLVLGSALALIGISRNTLNGILIEQFGSAVVGITTVYYSILAFAYVGWGAISPMSIILAWGLANILRWFQLQMLLRTLPEDSK